MTLSHVKNAQEQNEQRVRAALRDDFARTAVGRKLLAQATGLSETQVSRAVAALVKKGFVVNDGTQKRPQWRSLEGGDS